MSYVYSDDEGEFLVKLARNVLETIVKTGKKPDIPPEAKAKLKEKSGVFVTLETLTGAEKQLRGCIGRPYPDFPLVQATIDSAVDSALHDPRFPSVKPAELDKIVVEVSILTPPTLIEVDSVKDYSKNIAVGRDGLIIARGWRKGLLLPQVAVEWKWDAKQFLEQTCWKAGLTPDMWMDKETKIYKFQAEIFHELEPNGKIEREPMKVA
ncbi:MAG TPA: TIGR00296 family protein [Candidatus Deferrimicrobium sp.]|nr:TIGR00296 family protein [Candidatus Deferrimicrobium sp.]